MAWTSQLVWHGIRGTRRAGFEQAGTCALWTVSLSPGRSASTSDIHNDNCKTATGYRQHQTEEDSGQMRDNCPFTCSVSLVEFDLRVHAVEEQIPELLALYLTPKHGLDFLKTLRLQVSHSLL